MKKTIRQLKQELRNFAKYNGKNTPLIEASRTGRVESVEIQLSKGADINEKGKFGYTALMTAACSDRLEVVNYLLGEGADVNLTNDFGDTALSVAYPDVQVLTVLVKAGADVNHKNERGQTPLMTMAFKDRGSFPAVKFLVEKGANVNEKDYDDATALIYAASKGHEEIVKYLIEECHANYNIVSGVFKGIRGTALDIAKWLGRSGVVEYLKKKIKS